MSLSRFGALGSELRHFQRPLAWVIFLGTLVSVTNAGIPWMVQIFFDALNAKDQEKAMLIPALFPVVYLVNGLCRYSHMTTMRYVGEQLTMRVRSRLLEKYMKLSLTFHNTYRGGTGGLISRTLNDVAVLQNGVGVVANLIREPLVAVFLLGYLLYTNWKLTALIILVTPLFLLVLKQTAKSLRKYGHNNQNELEDLTATLKESLDGVRVIQSFNLEDGMAERFRDQGDSYLATRKRILAREELTSPVNDLLASFLFAGICVYVGGAIVGGEMTLGQFTGFVAALGFFQKPVKNLQDSYVKLQQAIVVMDRISEVLQTDQQVRQIGKPQSFPHAFQKISFDRVGFAYPGSQRSVLRHVSFDVSRGQVVAFVGSSGSGKSTLVNFLPRFFDPSQGQIRLDGAPLTDFDLRDLRDHVALVTQDVFLFRDTIENNILAGLPAGNRQQLSVEEAAKAANAYDFIQRLPEGFQTNVGERGALLSGGERQRISIARAFMKNAPILILDEATSALDTASEIEVQKGLEKLMSGRTVFVIAHRLSTVVKADRIFVMRDGEIVESGTHTQLVDQNGPYRQFIELQKV